VLALIPPGADLLPTALALTNASSVRALADHRGTCNFSVKVKNADADARRGDHEQRGTGLVNMSEWTRAS
jgi:hypothetical protein